MNRIIFRHNALALIAFIALALPTLVSCVDDEPDGNFFTFTGEMASDYMRSRSQYSEFTKIVERANQSGSVMDMLSGYGHFTCLLPTNDAVALYLQEKGLTSVDQLSDADCDTIARSHFINNMYSKLEMITDMLPTANLNNNYIGAVDTTDEEGRRMILFEGTARSYYPNANGQLEDTVENGYIHEIDHVIGVSNSTLTDIARRNSDNSSIFFDALVATGIDSLLTYRVQDDDYDPNSYPKYYYTSDFWHEVAWAPETKRYGFTLFVEPDEVYYRYFDELGITTDRTKEGNLRAVYELASHYYGHKDIFGADVNKEGWKFENLKDSINPLKRFVQYHILNRKIEYASNLTPLIHKSMSEAFGFETTMVNPIDWYTTLLPHTMLKIEQLTVKEWFGKGTKNERYVNRRYDDNYQIEGAHIVINDEKEENNRKGINGKLFYVDDLIVFNDEVRNIVQNMRIRMDFSTVFPEVITNKMRFVGNYDQDDDSSTPDDNSVPKNGKNYYFPEGYLDGVSFSNCHLVLRRPHQNFWSWQGDEWNIFGQYDFTFRLPPIPYSGDWQIRLGFCALKTRGVAQVYLDGVPQGIPLDMTTYLNEEAFLGDRFDNNGSGDESGDTYDKKTSDEKAKEQKVLKNLKAYRAGRAIYHTNGSTKYFFIGNPRTFRRVLCQGTLDATQDHYLRFRVASESNQGNDNEFMLDYLELVPKSVYGVDGDGSMEDDL